MANCDGSNEVFACDFEVRGTDMMGVTVFSLTFLHEDVITTEFVSKGRPGIVHEVTWCNMGVGRFSS